jgi:hypothetical protein
MTVKDEIHRKLAILMVMLDPPDSDEQEFHDWYDLEHVPERAAIQGFHSLQRYVCLEGWPRYMALYDIESLEVLHSEAYRAVAGDKFSPWSKRVIAKVRGWTRTEAEQVLPGSARTGANGLPLRLVVLRFRDVPESDAAALQAALDDFVSDRPDVLQSRLFRSRSGSGDHFYALVELSAPCSLANLNWERMKLPSGVVDIANVYTRYWRRED